MNSKKLLLIYLLLSSIILLNAQDLDFKKSIANYSIHTKKGIESIIEFSKNNSEIDLHSIDKIISEIMDTVNNEISEEQYLKSLFIKGYIFFYNKKYVQALKVYKQIIENTDNSKFQLLQEIYSQIGLVYQRIYYPKEADYYYRKSLNIQIEKIKDDQKICDLYVLLGNTQLGLFDYKKSLEYYKNSLSLAEKTNNIEAIVRASINIGNLKMRIKSYSEAEKITKESLELSEQYNLVDKIPICYLNLGEIYEFRKEYDKALYNFQKTLETINTEDLFFLKPLCYKKLVIIYSKLNDSKNTEISIIKHYEYISNYDSGLRLAQSLRSINNILKTNSNFNFAYKYIVRNTELLDSIIVSENRNRILMIESLHSLEKEKILNQKQLSNLKLALVLGTIILTLLIFIIFLLIRTRRKIMTQSKKIIEQNEELFAYKNHLEEIVAKRTEELKISLDKAEESNRLKTSFLNNISHEIRTPMNAIIGFSQLLVNEGNDQNIEYIEIIDNHANQLMVFIDKIVQLSKIQAGSEESNTKSLSILKFLKEIKSEAIEIKTNLGKNDIEFKVKHSSIKENISFFTDEIKLHTIIIQILENAFKFTEKGKVTLNCEITSKNAIFIIEDTGIGINQNKLPFIFDNFRIIEDNKNAYRGAGMGLALANKIAKLLNGEIKVFSEPKKGSKFTIIIPYSRI